MARQKVIGIDARFFGEAGSGRYVKAIVEHLEKVDSRNKYFVYVRKRGWNDYHPKNPNFTKVLADYRWYSWGEQFGFLSKVVQSKLDLFYVPHFNIPVLYPKAIITAIPDIIMHTYSTEKGTTLPIWYFRFKKIIYKLVVLWAVLRSKKVIVPSNDVISDFVKCYPYIPKNKYVLAYEGVDPVFLDTSLNAGEVLSKLGVKKPFLLYVSNFYEHKNTYRLLEAYKVLKKVYGFGGQLVMVGKKDKFSQKFYTKVLEEGLEKDILLPGLNAYVEDREVVALRMEAEAYVFPSLKEGFSLTPLEAQALGLPCVISDIPSHKEIYGDSVLYFDPNDIEDMAKKVNIILTDESLKKSFVTKGYAQSRKYSWVETAKITLGVFEKYL